MNTTADNGFNDTHGLEVAALIDRAAQELIQHSPGCAMIDGLMADCWDGYDPWGSNIEARFALEYACQFVGWPTDPEFHSPHTTGDPDEGYLYVGLRDWMLTGVVTPDDVEYARRTLSVLDHGLRLAGLDY